MQSMHSCTASKSIIPIRCGVCLVLDGKAKAALEFSYNANTELILNFRCSIFVSRLRAFQPASQDLLVISLP